MSPKESLHSPSLKKSLFKKGNEDGRDKLVIFYTNIIRKCEFVSVFTDFRFKIAPSPAFLTFSNSHQYNSFISLSGRMSSSQSKKNCFTTFQKLSGWYIRDLKVVALNKIFLDTMYSLTNTMKEINTYRISMSWIQIDVGFKIQDGCMCQKQYGTHFRLTFGFWNSNLILISFWSSWHGPPASQNQLYRS